MKKFFGSALAAIGALTLIGAALPAVAQAAEIVIGINLSTTGPASSLGVPERNALEFVPKEIGGIPLRLVILDDGSDRWTANANARKLATELKADVLIGSTTTPATLAAALIASEYGIPQIGLAPMTITPAREKWSIISNQSIPLMTRGLYDHMRAHGVKKVGFLGYSEPWGDLWYNDLDENSHDIGISIVDDLRFARTDTSITGQILQLIALNPDAVLIGASGVATVLPQVALRQHGYKGLIYQTQGAAEPEFIRMAGQAAEGVIMVAPPMMYPEGLPDSSPVKRVATAFNASYEAKYGPLSRSHSASHTFDAFEILGRVIPVALKTARPGTPEFRDAVRQALLTEREIVGTQGVFNFTATDRYGQDERSRILVTVKDGKYMLVK